MNRGLKALGIVLSLLLMSVLLMVMLVTSSSVALPFPLFNRNRLLFNTFINQLLQQYLFWVALVFFIALLLLIFFSFIPGLSRPLCSITTKANSPWIKRPSKVSSAPS